MTEFSVYFTGNRASDAALDEEDENEDCFPCLVFMQPAIKSISPLFLCAALHSKYPGCILMFHKCHLFLGNISLSGL